MTSKNEETFVSMFREITTEAFESGVKMSVVMNIIDRELKEFQKYGNLLTA